MSKQRQTHIGVKLGSLLRFNYLKAQMELMRNDKITQDELLNLLMDAYQETEGYQEIIDVAPSR